MRAKQSLGQHFLTDPKLLGRIADALDPVPDDIVLEIGPGRGSLTEVLLARGVWVIAIEKDRRLAEELRDAGGGMRDAERLKMLEGDALRLDWHAVVAHPASRISHPGFKVVGNIPYNITSPLLEKALTPPLPERIVFLVQDEVASRVAAPPGSKTYGALSVGVQAVCRVEKLFTIAPGAFRPAPKVRSALLRLTPLAEPLVRPEEAAAFRAFVTGCFSRRRKQLHNAVPGATAAALTALGLDPTMRPETVAPADFVRLLRCSQQL
ncbi:MAG TPA: 16S rRNA (adenine(1518)-N(6)/adenine(1519)-N(6))-dimethyltransferase RsmA [Gemmatimonadales bacterium]|nr:16S rRNA (adenine(1518)-N(6)/adenine(1519)-N(6))-dimethyltransferase RsmA [Gemmatimonadales bacterium]